MFETFYKTNPDLDNAEYYQTSPSVNTGTIRSWNAKAKSRIVKEPDQTPPTEVDQTSVEPEVKRLKAELIEALKEKTRFNDELLNGLNEDAQITILKNVSKDQGSDPNIRLMTPAGSSNQKLGIEKYMTIDEESFKKKGFGEVTVALPASIAFDPKKSAELTKYK